MWVGGLDETSILNLSSSSNMGRRVEELYTANSAMGGWESTEWCGSSRPHTFTLQLMTHPVCVSLLHVLIWQPPSKDLFGRHTAEEEPIEKGAEQRGGAMRSPAQTRSRGIGLISKFASLHLITYTWLRLPTRLTASRLAPSRWSALEGGRSPATATNINGCVCKAISSLVELPVHMADPPPNATTIQFSP